MKRIIKKIYLLGPLVFLLASPLPAYAALFDVTGAIVNFLLFPLVILQYVGALLFSFANWFLNMVLDLNYGILDHNSLIETGWTIVRDITNLGFVLVIIVIAISTIIRYEKYAMKALLPKLIGAAIVVNFSLTIAGVFIDFSHSMTRFFFDPLQGQGAFGLVDTLSAAFRPQSLLIDSDDIQDWQPGGGGGLGSDIIIHVSGLVFVVIFTFMAAFVILALAIMFFLRYLNLSFLLILAPIVWLFWVVPAFQKYHGEWWGAFTKWIIFGPAASFFIYLSLVSIERLGETKASGEAGAAFFGDGIIQTTMKHGVNMVVLTGFFFGSLIVAQKLGVAGAAGMMGLAKKASGAAKKKVGAYAKQRAKNTRDRALSWGAQTDQNTGQTTTGLQRLVGRAAQLPGGGVFKGLSQNLSKQRVEAQKAVEERQKNLGAMDTASLEAFGSKAGVLTPPAESAAMLAELAKRGRTDAFRAAHPERFDHLMRAARRTNSTGSILQYRPDLAPQIRDLNATNDPTGARSAAAIRDAMRSVKKIDDLEAVSFGNAPTGAGAPPPPSDAQQEIIFNLTVGQSEKLGRDGSNAQKEAVIESLGHLTTPAILATLTPTQQARVTALRTHIAASVNWQ